MSRNLDDIEGLRMSLADLEARHRETLDALAQSQVRCRELPRQISAFAN